ncbi:hypothetical protein PENANT_c002G03548 [Penicillium antarcticum]|uniref:Zn(2)-C6 fungal-type domain-containing protein n=1 Tax=Penicillium antarcticum TaxID=416450 RepID=A0A1V6QJN9_9EURO|nr:uncharacterized protein N7508_006579 [Penicillium antarcticum]KAJ5301716.1 hypothetical protein N7508_006579 [Penicillium antarcticum]OQD89415.1 hypothetical protein PENANT_c002G03548 [Penicillium antarcticum]
MVVKACDRCRSSKEKCAVATDNPACTRCIRLKLPCSILRRNKRVSRRLSPKTPVGETQVAVSSIKSVASVNQNSPTVSSRRSVSSISTPPMHRTEASSTPISTGPVVIAPEKLLASTLNLQTTSDALRTVLDVEQFSVIHLPFMLGSSFIPESQKTVYAILCLSAPTLTEGYLAFLGLMTSYQRSLVMRRGEPDMCKAAMGLQRLRSVKISHDYDAACALFLGQTMYVFNVLTAPYSNTAHSIVRSALMSTKKWVPRLLQFPIMDTITMSPILIDTVECLVHREIPIIRLHPQRRVIVDRYAGLCATLLPHLYDICECSHALKRNVFEAGSESHSAIYDRLGNIEEAIRYWRPKTPTQIFENYGQHAVLAMVTQANVYRLAALLLIHRLRHPLGVENAGAQKLANNIFAELAFFAKSSIKDTTALPVVFPLTMAMLEIKGPGEDLLERLASFSVQSTSASRLQEFVQLVRSSRESGFEGTLFDLVESHLHVAMPP